MPWHYRVFHTCYTIPGNNESRHDYTIRDTYYDEDGSIAAISARATCPRGETLPELMKDLARMQEAFSRPVLTPEDIPGYDYAINEMAPPA